MEQVDELVADRQSAVAEGANLVARRPRDNSAYGLRFRSDLPLPFRRAGSVGGTPDVRVRFGPVPRIPDPPAAAPGPPWLATADAFRLDVDGVARYLVRDGSEIVVDAAGGSEADVLAFLLGSVLAACLQQRGVLTLHASAIETAGGAVLFAGPSGSGKSTLAAALVARGHRMLADDVTTVVFEGGRPLAQSAFPSLRLWKDALDSLKWRAQADARVRPGLGKYAVPVDRFRASPLPVRAVLALNRHNRNAAEIEPVPPAAAFEMLLRRTYRMRYVMAMERTREHFDAVARLARAVPAYRILRPSGSLRPDALAELVETHLRGCGPCGRVLET